jgi:hypothetical protein
MTSSEYLEDTFALTLLGGAREPVVPASYYNEDGDCIEIRLSDESYFADRADGLVTLYIGRETGKVVGAVIKGVTRFLQQILESAPGFRVEIMDHDGFRVEHLLSVVLWKRAPSPYDECTVKRYKYLREAAEENNLTVDLKRTLDTVS